MRQIYPLIFRDAGVTAIESLMKRKGKFDYILLETTGLADPGPIASMFWLDEGLGSEIMLDGKEIWIRIVTLEDSYRHEVSVIIICSKSTIIIPANTNTIRNIY